MGNLKMLTETSLAKLFILMCCNLKPKCCHLYISELSLCTFCIVIVNLLTTGYILYSGNSVNVCVCVWGGGRGG
jgi:hypothetical protein